MLCAAGYNGGQDWLSGVVRRIDYKTSLKKLRRAGEDDDEDDYEREPGDPSEALFRFASTSLRLI